MVCDDQGNVKELVCSYLPESKSGCDNSGVKVKGVIQWVDANNYAELTLRRFKPMLNPEIDATDYIEKFDRQSMTLQKAFAEKAVCDAKVEDKFQFMRKGYYCVDKDSTANNLIFNSTISLKDSWSPNK